MLRTQEELEVALDSGSEGEAPDWLKTKALSVDNAAKRRRSKTAAPGPSQPDSEVQDLTGADVTCMLLCCVGRH